MATSRNGLWIGVAVALPLLFSAACTPQQSEEPAEEQNAELTQQQKDQIKSEVKAVGDSIMARFARLDGAGAFQFYANTPDWVMFNADGSQWDYETTRKAMADSTNAFAAYQYTTTRQDFMVVNKDMVIEAWVIKDEATLKSGDIMTIDPHAYTILFKRIAGQWKVVWSHDSGFPVMKKPS